MTVPHVSCKKKSTWYQLLSCIRKYLHNVKKKWTTLYICNIIVQLQDVFASGWLAHVVAMFSAPGNGSQILQAQVVSRGAAGEKAKKNPGPNRTRIEMNKKSTVSCKLSLQVTMLIKYLLMGYPLISSLGNLFQRTSCVAWAQTPVGFRLDGSSKKDIVSYSIHTSDIFWKCAFYAFYRCTSFALEQHVAVGSGNNFRRPRSLQVPSKVLMVRFGHLQCGDRTFLWSSVKLWI